MIWLILTVVVAAAGVGAYFFATGLYRIFVPIGVAGAWVILTLALSLHTVGQRQVGIVQSFSGTIGDNYKSAGVVFTAPWNHILTENIGIQKEVFTFDGSNSAVSRDQQPIVATLVVNYQVEPANVIKLYKTVGPAWKTVLLDGRVPQDFKVLVAGHHSAAAEASEDHACQAAG
jgi:regulator of protease activity HflC (stomatin/prohibitin superfamily)